MNGTRWNTAQPWKEATVPSAATWMDLELTKLKSVKRRDKDHSTPLICGTSNTTQMSLSMKKEADSQTENRLVVVKGKKGWRGMDWDFGISSAD